MARRIIRQYQQPKVMSTWWVRALFAVIFLSLAYGFVSWAVDSGSMLHWALGLFFLGWAISDVIHSIRFAFDR